MSDEWTTFNVKYFAIPFTMLVFGIVIGFGISNSSKKSTKHYPIEVETHWHVGNHEGYVPMECDSVKGDTIYKDGLSIIEKNLTYIKFK